MITGLQCPSLFRLENKAGVAITARAAGWVTRYCSAQSVGLAGTLPSASDYTHQGCLLSVTKGEAQFLHPQPCFLLCYTLSRMLEQLTRLSPDNPARLQLSLFAADSSEPACTCRHSLLHARNREKKKESKSKRDPHRTCAGWVATIPSPAQGLEALRVKAIFPD